MIHFGYNATMQVCSRKQIIEGFLEIHDILMTFCTFFICPTMNFRSISFKFSLPSSVFPASFKRQVYHYLRDQMA